MTTSQQNVAITLGIKDQVYLEKKKKNNMDALCFLTIHQVLAVPQGD